MNSHKCDLWLSSCYLAFESLCRSTICLHNLVARNRDSLAQVAKKKSYYNTNDVLHFYKFIFTYNWGGVLIPSLFLVVILLLLFKVELYTDFTEHHRLF